ncbi:NAD-dependent succinate-semialdehyde dehydrogenase [Ruegeria sp. 2012CJ41-6]|uniref:NAD-dependent succinate-semialdehyde dehydrogenase n=1 Tax=Ruegeria spongiae TaxID=2942209 RepID=A0ABT0Q305_9RHOB|nr:NAD-dependent succinate-semialdehyde dehydrogenase [Ruegeria spongiae]MCL6284182.1 NAD-dependent succinate-semialdehyde dehydrogenase [Ruegeria spongiae]
MPEYPSTQLFLNGRWQPARDGRVIDVLNPATQQKIGTVSHAGIADLDEALAAADNGFRIWRDISPYERAAVLRKAAGLLRDRVDSIARIMTLEQGKPLAQSRLETLAAADIIDWFAGEGQRAYGQIIPARNPNTTQMTLKLPVGPVAAFTPWNFPINQAVRKLSAGLAAGCSVIVKAPEETPAAPAALIQAFADAGLPDGVVGLVFGEPAQISEYLIPHPVICKISFTGSTPVGKHLAELAGRHMKRATMELGGHAPVIVAADADLDQALSVIVPAKFRNAGQVCISPTRFLVHEDLADDFTNRFVEQAEAIKLGNGLDADVEMGPLANERRLAAMDALVEDAVESGAKLRTGGKRASNQGWFFQPTVLTHVAQTARIMNEEPFGPVAVINPVKNLDAAISEANRLPYGLAAYGFTRDSNTAARLGREVEAGMTAINHAGFALPEVPFGGIRDSGHGTEGGSEALDSYLNTRFVTHLH